MRRIMVSAVPSTKGRREHDPLGASACSGSRRLRRHSIFAAGTEVPSAKREEIKSASSSVLKPADLRSGCLAHRHELRIRYDSHHQQQQKQYDYDEFDPFPTRVREPSNHCVDHHWPPKIADRCWPLPSLARLSVYLRTNDAFDNRGVVIAILAIHVAVDVHRKKSVCTEIEHIIVCDGGTRETSIAVYYSDRLLCIRGGTRQACIFA